MKDVELQTKMVLWQDMSFVGDDIKTRSSGDDEEIHIHIGVSEKNRGRGVGVGGGVMDERHLNMMAGAGHSIYFSYVTHEDTVKVIENRTRLIVLSDWAT